jgi:heat shock protein HslJ
MNIARNLGILLLLCYVATGCNQKSPTQPAKGFLHTLWTLESFSINGDIVKAPESQSFTIKFKEDNRFSGQSDCNSIGGAYKINENYALVISEAGTTEVGCGPKSMGDVYFQALIAAKSFEITKNTLTIFYAEKSRLVFTYE